MFNVRLNCFIDKPQTHFLRKCRCIISPFSVWTLIAWLFLQRFTISPIYFGKTMKIPLQSKPFSLKQLPVSHFGQTMFVRITEWAILRFKCYLQLVIKKIWHNFWQTWHVFMTIICHSECLPHTINISGIHDIGFLDTWSFLHCSPLLALNIHNVIEVS